MHISVSDVSMQATVRVHLKSFVPTPPYAAVLGVSLLQLPHVDFSLHAIGMDITSVPGLQTLLVNVLKVCG